MNQGDNMSEEIMLRLKCVELALNYGNGNHLNCLIEDTKAIYKLITGIDLVTCDEK